MSVAKTLHTKTPEGAVTYLRTDQAGMSPLRYQKWLRLNEVRRPMLNEHYDVTTAAYAVGYESYPISVGNIRGCLESHPREIVRSSRLAKAGDLSSAVGFNIKLNDCDTNVSSNAAVAFWVLLSPVMTIR